MEDKKAICQALAAAIRLTRGNHDLKEIHYFASPDNYEVAMCDYATHMISVDITADSGCAMIRDICKAVM